MELGTQPRCDHIAMWTSNRCRRPAAVRVFRSHGGGVNPVYKERCLYHAANDLRPNLVAVWDETCDNWIHVGV
jgi:hypothetical protein